MRWIRRILVMLLILVVAFGGFGFWMVRRSFPQVDGAVDVPGLGSSVEVIRDPEGVPHIYAATTHDLFFAQGYVHAQDRFWQMDFWRHIGAGRLSEMFGDGQVESDMFLRSLDFTGLAEQEFSALGDEDREALQAYADGVNAYLGDHQRSRLSLEYAILSLQNSEYEVEPWTPVNSLTWAKVMSWDLSWNMLQEIDRARLSVDFPLDRIEQLYPEYPDDHPVIVPSDQAPSAEAPVMNLSRGILNALTDAGDRARSVWDLTGGGFAGIGSNNWVVGGSHTESGLPILANDPHLAIQMPSIWYVNGLHCVETTPDCPYQVAGFSFAGIPGVVIGHNEHIAWGVTNESVDTQDLFIEKMNPDDPHQYEYQGQWVDAKSRSETIVVAGGDDIAYDVLVTRHGPIISDTYFDEPPFQGSTLDLPNQYAVSLAWQSLQPSTLVEALMGINRATTYNEFRAAASKWDIAAQNLVYADVEGNIAYQSTGEIPIRIGYDGSWPVPGWTDDDYQFADGWVPFDDLPRMLNPPRDYVASANNPVIAGGEPFFSADFDFGYRAARIEEMIQESAAYTVESAQAMQRDNRDGGAANLVPYLLDVSSDDPGVHVIQDLLARWSEGAGAFQAAGDSAAAAAYQVTWTRLLELTFHDELPEDSWPEGGSRWFEVVARLLETPDDPWWDDVSNSEVQNRDSILEAAMAEAHTELTEALGDPDSWKWSRIHTAAFENQTLGQSGIGPIEWLFNRNAPERLGGGADIVNAVGYYPPDGYVVDWIPSMRMVIDLSDFASSTAGNATGQSGHAFNSHYDDQIGDWADGLQRPLRWTREQVEADAVATLVLKP